MTELAPPPPCPRAILRVFGPFRISQLWTALSVTAGCLGFEALDPFSQKPGIRVHVFWAPAYVLRRCISGQVLVSHMTIFAYMARS